MATSLTTFEPSLWFNIYTLPNGEHKGNHI
ncbi:hypothetical protein C8D95_10964 [Silicimonas algicola]|uniref:Uncharacterized protein n=1 Tax=Silicimonas algicola TaxID=1826607 RepID=A0A316GJI9_9RHOB|nr:hypothetical protein C8D95_10964 [Silicimonas algicola]